jgi:hypothetical protein
LTVIRVFEELRGRGYEGGFDAVRRYARRWARSGQTFSMIFMPFSCLVGAHLSTAALAIAVIAGQQLAHLPQIQHADEELGGDVAVKQPIPVLAENGIIPYWIVDRKSDKPAEQQIVVELLHQLPLGSHRVQRLNSSARNNRSGAIDGRPMRA